MPPEVRDDTIDSPPAGAAPLWIAARRLLKGYGKELFKRWKKTTDSFSVEDIHDLRVSSRRVREGLLLFETCFPEKRLASLAKKVKRVTTVLGELRNTDEAVLFFSQLTPEEREGCDPELTEMLARLATEALAARRRLEEELGALKPAPLKARFEAELNTPFLFGNQRTDPFQQLSSFADQAIAARALPVSELLPLALEEANASAQHRLRIAVKRLRYRMEILQELFGPSFSELHASLKGYQEVLGKLHDLDVFSALVLERIPAGAAQHSLLRVLTDRRTALFQSFTAMLQSSPLDTLGARARSLL